MYLTNIHSAEHVVETFFLSLCVQIAARVPAFRPFLW